MTPPEIAIAGPGRMGIGIATAVLMTGQGHRVTLLDTKPRPSGRELEALDRARDEVAANLKLLSGLGAIAPGWEPLLGNLHFATEMSDELGACRFIFEALPETMGAKQLFYEQLGRHAAPDAVVASATSTFDVSVFSALYDRPARVLTAHWLNPAFLIPLVELARSGDTASDAVDALRNFLEQIGKIPVTLRSSPGFIVPRIQAAAMNEAVRILEEEVATAEEIDTAIKAGFGFRLAVLGLIEFIDLGGVDILARADDYLFSALQQSQFRPPRLVAEKMALGELGPRTGKGFFDYTGVDTRGLFESRYRGFLEMLRLFQTSETLRFAGGISPEDAGVPPSPTT